MNAINNSLVGAIRTEASLDGGKFVDGAKKIKLAAKDTETQVKKSFSAMGTAVKGFGGALTAGLSIGLLGGLAKKALDFATSIKDVAAQAGVSTKALQEFRYAASQVGIKQADADKALERFNLTLGKAAAGSKSAKEALAAVGITMKDVASKTPIENFGKMADQINRQGGAAKNAAPLNAVLGDSYAKLNPLVDKGSAGLNQLAEAANRLGIVLSDSQIQQADETARKLDDVRQVLAAQIAGVVADNASSIVTLAQSLATLTSEIIRFLGSNPQLALGIIGALAGSRFGLPGAAAGAVIGASAGGRIAQQQADANPDLAFRAQQLRAAQARFRKARSLTSKSAPDAQFIAAEKDLRKQIELTNKAMANRGKTAAQAVASVPQFLAPDVKSGGGRKARTPKAPRDRSDDVTFQFDQELRRAQIDVLRAQQGLARTSEDRAAIALQLLDAEKAMQNAELDDRVRRAERDFAEGKITEGALKQVKVQAEKLRLEYDSVDALERQAVADDLAADKARDAAKLKDSDYDLQLELLQLEASLKDTAGERREAELRILDLMKQQEKARLEAVIADKDSSELAKEEARRRLAALDKIYDGRKAAAMQGNRSPGEAYLDSLPTTPEKFNDELEEVAVGGLKSLEDGLTAVLDGTKSVKEAFHDLARSILSDLIRLSIRKMIITPLANALFGGGGFSEGGFTGFASGGWTGSGGRNRIAGVVHGQEFVLNADATRQIGIPDLNMLNRGAPLSSLVGNDNQMSGGGDLNVSVALPRGMAPREGRATGLAIGRGILERQRYSIRGRK